MWAQIIKTRLKPGREADFNRLFEMLQSVEQPDSGLVRSTAMRDQNDPNTIYMMVVFGSEEQARAREQDPRRQEGLQEVLALMADVLDGPREFINLEVLKEVTSW